MSVFIFIIIIVGLVTFGEVAKSWLDGRPERPELEPEGGRDGEIERLREHVSLLARQVDRLTEEQRFMTRLLENEPAARPAALEREGRNRLTPAKTRPGARPDSRLREPERC